MDTPVRLTAGLPHEHGHAIAQLSSDLHVPVSEVAAEYQAQLDRIGESARITHYLGVLASSHVRSILRKRQRHSATAH